MGWHRSELVRQRDLLRSVPRWYLGPFVPGLVLTLVGLWLANPGGSWRVGLGAAFVALVFAGVAWLNFRGARKLDEQIEVRRADVKPARRISIAPAQKNVRLSGSPELLRRTLFRRPLVAGDVVVRRVVDVLRRRVVAGDDDRIEAGGDAVGSCGRRIGHGDGRAQ